MGSSSSPTPRSDVLVWIDLEMSGLDPERERILEIATLVTDSDLNLLAEGPDLVVHQDNGLLVNMDAWNQDHHGKSGLIESVQKSQISEPEAELATLAFLRSYSEEGSSPMCGNSVHQDRRFLVRAMPELAGFFHYRNLDVSTIKELARRWYPEIVAAAPEKGGDHRAMADIRESVEELRWYRRRLFPAPRP